jgi:DNA-binding CsgD family transcriptional regulator
MPEPIAEDAGHRRGLSASFSIQRSFVLLGLRMEIWQGSCFLWRCGPRTYSEDDRQTFGGEAEMTNLNQIKITPRDHEVLRLLVQGCSNKEIANQLNISPRTVKQHLRTLFLRAGIRDGRKRVKLATAMYQKEQKESCHQEVA